MSAKVVDLTVENRSRDFSVRTASNKLYLSKANLNKIPIPTKNTLRIWDTKQQGLFIKLPASGNAVAYYRYRLNTLQRDYRIGRVSQLMFAAFILIINESGCIY